ncbi:MAG: hypothetical protein JRG95_11865 [Deltaproteobacteria bacterium]|nr:hypothetical protein [Deltaproteobacteria bacterium]
MSGWLWVGLIGSLAIGLQLSRRLFALPRFDGASPAERHACCDRPQFEQVVDFGQAAGFDFDLGRCGSCGAWLMAVFRGASITCNVISEEQAEHFLGLQGTPELRRALKTWVN